MSKIYVKCQSCGEVFNKLDGVSAPSLDRGGRDGWLCSSCATHTWDYGFRQMAERGGVNAPGTLTGSMELETSEETSTGRLNLMRLGFIPTRDVSIYGNEYKSPVWHGMGGITKTAHTIGRLMEEGHIFIGEECGTHIHIGRLPWLSRFGRSMKLDGNMLSVLWEWRYPLLSALEEEIADRDETDRLYRVFGRSIGDYREKLEDATPVFVPDDGIPLHNGTWRSLWRDTESEREHGYRYAWMNFCSSTDKTIEFRLPVFRTERQFKRCLKFCSVVTRKLCDFAEYVDAVNIGYYPTELLRERARKTALSLLREYRKY